MGIKHPEAIWGEDEQRWISDAEVAEIAYTAFTSRKKAEHVAARLIVRRVRCLNPTSAGAGAEHGELLTAYRHHAVFTDSRLAMLEAEACHPDHAIIEQVIADLKNGPLAHCGSGVLTANSAWAVLAAIAFNLTRAAGVLASRFHARARAATIRAQLINAPARIANRAHSCLLHTQDPGPGSRLGTRSSRPPADRYQRRLDRQPLYRREGKRKWKGRADRQITRALHKHRPAFSSPSTAQWTPETRSAYPG